MVLGVFGRWLRGQMKRGPPAIRKTAQYYELFRFIYFDGAHDVAAVNNTRWCYFVNFCIFYSIYYFSAIYKPRVVEREKVWRKSEVIDVAFARLAHNP